MNRSPAAYPAPRDLPPAMEALEPELAALIDWRSDGVILFDAEDKVAFVNERYKDLHPPIAAIVRLGVTFEEILREAVRTGGVAIPADEVESWIGRCMSGHFNPGEPFESRLADGRWLKIVERKTAAGGILGVHYDITAEKTAAA